MASSRSAQESFFDGLRKTTDDREIGADRARRLRPAKFPMLQRASTESVTAGEGRAWWRTLRANCLHVYRARYIVLVCAQRDLTPNMRGSFLQSMNNVPSYAAEPPRRALTYPLASWHLSNPPRTSSLPFDPQPSCPIVHSWRRSKSGTPYGPILARRALRSSASSSKSPAHRHSCPYPAGPSGPFGRPGTGNYGLCLRIGGDCELQSGLLV